MYVLEIFRNICVYMCHKSLCTNFAVHDFRTLLVMCDKALRLKLGQKISPEKVKLFPKISFF